MAAYMNVLVTVRDPAWIGEYVRNVPGIMGRHGGYPIALSGPVETLEGDAAPTQIAIFAFPNMDALKAFMSDPDYLPWKKTRLEGADTTIFAFDPVDKPAAA